MNKFYMLCDTDTKKLTTRISCPESMIDGYPLASNEVLIEGDVDMHMFRANDSFDGFVEYTETEKEDLLFSRRENNIPPGLNTDLSDSEINDIISEYFLGRVTPSVWRVQNYKILRQMFYRTRDNDVRDAQGKINDPDGDEVIIAEGQSELTEYYNWRKYSVKNRFPKTIQE